jgi:actin-related protein 5
MTTLELKDTKTIPDPIHTYPKNVRNSSTPLVIDNGKCIYLDIVLTFNFGTWTLNLFNLSSGSYQCRVGWATQKEPLLIFKNLVAKPRKERGKKVMIYEQRFRH